MLSRVLRLRPAFRSVSVLRPFSGSSFLDRADAEARVLDVLKRFPKIKESSVAVDIKSNLGDSLGLDSLDQVELIMEIEEEFTIEITDDNLEKIHTVEDIVSYVTSNPMSQ
jgi:NADH dehydrogenase (ubiquinone) 1 alpha/beta subcomplex 1